jgi:hypothetical protein
MSRGRLSFLMQPQKSRGPSPLAAQPSNARKKLALTQLILSGVEPLAPGDAQCCDGWMGRTCFLTTGERAKFGAGDRDAMCPENCNPEHSCAASATRAPAASHIRANLRVCLRCFRALARAPTPRIVRDHAPKNKMRRSCSPRPSSATSISQSCVAALPSTDTLRPGPATAPLIASSSKELHRGPYQQA